MVDYSKWKKIEISDDEDDTHPNIDTASLFRWRHKARLERQEEQRKAKAENAEKRAQLTAKLAAPDITAEERAQLERELAEVERKEKELEKRQKLQPWNVDTIGQDSWSGTVINKKCLGGGGDKDCKEKEEDSEEMAISYREHVGKYEADIKQFAFHSNFDDCRRFLLSHPNLVHTHTLDYLSLWCMQLDLDGKHALLEHVARQAVIIQMILDLAKTVGGGIDPRSCLGIFFERSAKAKEKFDRMFNEELVDFRERVAKAAQIRLEQAIAEQEANPEKLVGPGGLNAQEVFDSLPVEMQKCFETRSVQQMQEVLSKMEPDQAEYHLKRCIDAGLWNPSRTEEQDEEDQLLLKAMERNAKVATTEKREDSSEVDSEDLDELDSP